MSGPEKTHGRFFGKWYMTNHVINSYKKRVPDPRRKLTKSDIERTIAGALHDIDLKSLGSLPMLDGCYIYESYLSPRGQLSGPYYFLLEPRSRHDPDKPAIVALWTEEIYRKRLENVKKIVELNDFNFEI